MWRVAIRQVAGRAQEFRMRAVTKSNSRGGELAQRVGNIEEEMCARRKKRGLTTHRGIATGGVTENRQSTVKNPGEAPKDSGGGGASRGIRENCQRDTGPNREVCNGLN